MDKQNLPPYIASALERMEEQAIAGRRLQESEYGQHLKQVFGAPPERNRDDG